MQRRSQRRRRPTVLKEPLSSERGEVRPQLAMPLCTRAPGRTREPTWKNKQWYLGFRGRCGLTSSYPLMPYRRVTWKPRPRGQSLGQTWGTVVLPAGRERPIHSQQGGTCSGNWSWGEAKSSRAQWCQGVLFARSSDRTCDRSGIAFLGETSCAVSKKKRRSSAGCPCFAGALGRLAARSEPRRGSPACTPREQC